MIASALKSYLRDLPEPLLTFALYDQFIAAAARPTEEQRKIAIKNAINQLPKCNYMNLRYLTKFLGKISSISYFRPEDFLNGFVSLSELLSQKSKSNKMSPQNIAIVMSPNLLWSPDTGNENDYMSKVKQLTASVNSTASVNTIVEALVSDWPYFFGDDFAVSDFYVTLTRDELFPHNGGFPVDRDYNNSDNIMTKSLNIAASAGNSVNNHHYSASLGGNNSIPNNAANQTHSRSSSHDTSLILLDSENALGSVDSLAKRSQSNSSLSDSSPPQQNSPKLPVRRKNNKKTAPTPPDNRSQRASEYYGSISGGSHQYNSESMHAIKERFMNSGVTPTNEDDPKLSSNRFLRNEAKAQSNASDAVFKQPMASMKRCSGSTENLVSKPDKPPRPAMPVESQTLSRSMLKSKGLDRLGRPVALPRNILNVARSTENLSSSTSPIKTSPNAHNDDGEPVLLRDQPNELARGDKPEIPQRPTSLMKPNFRTAVFDKFDSQQTLRDQVAAGDQSPGIKKAQSFRISSTPSNAAVGSITGRSLTTLERTHIYNVDKKQVEIIDVDQPNNGNGSNGNTATKPPAHPSVNGDKDKEKEKEKENEKGKEQPVSAIEIKTTENDENLLSASNVMTTSATNPSADGIPPVPQSPRNFEPKVIKRPPFPAPPPPNASTNHANEMTTATESGENAVNRKSDPPMNAAAAATTAADSTKL